MNSGPSKRTLLVEGNLLQGLLWQATPMLVGAILQNVQSIIDMFWVGRLGPSAVAAVAMSGVILMLLYPMLLGLSTGTVALVARAVGAGDIEAANRAAGQSLVMAVGVGLVMGAVGWAFTAQLLGLMQPAPDVLQGGTIFLHVSLLGSFTVFLLFIGNAALQGAGDAMSPMWIMVLSNVFNIGLEPLFIFGWGPVPSMGLRGAAIATLIAQALAALLAIHILFRGRTHLRVTLRHLIPDPGLCWRILRIGIPGSGQMLSRSLMGAVMMRIVAGCGTAAVAAYGTGLRLHMIVLMPAFALGGAAATMVGQNLGAGKPERARRAAWLATWLDVGVMVVAGALLMLFAAPLIRIFNTDADVVAIGARYLQVVSPSYVFAALGIVLGRALNGAGDTLAPMIATILSLWGLQVPLAIWLAHRWQPATDGVWWAIVASGTLHGILIMLWFQTNRWMKQRV